ncbi:hypothetical protein MSSIT_0413 [Methanosarcina siciliae T4/M]|uniref:Uncharacterized protein n=1 Tax=Methanosarcina siciliae T4/M TaxID=1434120 RepID=A0A0E3P1B6_9EURY|nr:hypothetical protein [Methanosarcina siciliae]AKB27132.1 hypothetical protein MSSIT_0413 [Methanosarcina siciliae T4/M]
MRKLIIGLGIMATLAVLSFGQATNFGSNVINTKDGGSVQYELEGSLPSINDTVKIYTIRNSIVTTESVAEIGSKFGFVNCSPSNADPGTIGMFDGEKHLSVYEKSGAIWYVIPSKMDPVVDMQPNLPDDETAKKIATDFLVSTNCLPQDSKFNEIVADQQITAEKGTDKVIQSYNTTLQVRYQREINGIPVVGPGSKLKVFIGDNNGVVGMFKVWRDVMPDINIKIKTPEKAYSDLVEGNDIVLPVRADGDKVIIKNVTLGYWMEPADKEQTNVLPVYIFKGDVIDSNGKYSGQYEGYVYATEGGLI